MQIQYLQYSGIMERGWGSSVYCSREQSWINTTELPFHGYTQRKDIPRTLGRQGGPPGWLEENDPAGRVFLVMVSLECFPRIFPRIKHWAAWVHLHRKYSICRHELNHAQLAGASGVWLHRQCNKAELILPWEQHCSVAQSGQTRVALRGIIV